MSGRSIRIFLVDGTASGLRTAELGLSTIKALVVPRASLQAAGKRQEILRTGAYILVGRDSERPGLLKIYIGEGDTILARLAAHNKDADKDFWEDAILFISKDENLTKAHGRYLESRFISLAQQAKRCTVTNVAEPSEQGRLPEADEVEMEEFISQARLLLGTLGYDLFSPISENQLAQPQSPTSSDLTEFTYIGDGFSGTCVLDSNSGQFVVRKDSKSRKLEAPSLQQTYRQLRARLIENGVLSDDGDTYRFTQDYPFTAITAAAQVVSGSPINGRNAWRVKDDNMTFAEWQDAQLPHDAD